MLPTGKRKKWQGPSTSSSPAVGASPSVNSHVRLPSVSEDSVIRDTVLSYLSSLSKSGSLGTNLPSFTAPSPVPDLAPSIKGVTWGESGPEPHHLGGPTRSSDVGAGVISSSAASIPTVLPNISLPLNVQPRVMQDVSAAVAQPLAYASVPLASSGLDQSRFAGGDTVYVTAAASLSPTSLLFPLPPSSSSSSSSVLPPSSSSAPLSLFSSAAPPSLTPPPTAPLCSFSGSFPSSSFLPSFLLRLLIWSHLLFLFFPFRVLSLPLFIFLVILLFLPLLRLLLLCRLCIFLRWLPLLLLPLWLPLALLLLMGFLLFLLLLPLLLPWHLLPLPPLFLREFLLLLLLLLRLPLFLLPPLPLPLILFFRLG